MTESDAELAERTAGAALELLLRLRGEAALEGRALGDAADSAANRLILGALRRRRPEDSILSEESPDDPARLRRERVWIVDPLDGTREYVAGREDWAVHVALAVNGEARVGAVAVPGRGVFASHRVAPPPSAPRPRPLMLVSRSRPPIEAALVAAAIDADVERVGSAGAKAIAVVAGDADIYFHSGGQHEWDNCAPVAVAAAAGLNACRLDGAPLAYNRVSPFVPDLLICRPDLAGPVLAAVAAIRRSEGLIPPPRDRG